MKLSRIEYKAIVEFSPNMIWRAGLDANCNYFNDTWLKFTGKSLKDEIGSGWLSGVHPDDMDFCMKTYLDAFKKHEAFEMDYRLKRHDGVYRWINDRGVPIKDSNQNFAGYIGSCVDVTEKVEGQKLTEMAFNDFLTGVYNRNYLGTIINYEFKQAKEGNYDVFYMMLDVDSFKFVNDKFGHISGDKVLYSVAQVIKESVRDMDTVGRFGGDEFLVILPRIKINEVKEIATNILNNVSNIHINEVDIAITLSIGVSKQSLELDIEEVLENADQAMYQSKNNGGARVTYYN